MITRRDALKATLGLPLAAPFVGPAYAQDAFPSKLITLICPFATGSGGDIFARYYAARIKDVSGVGTIVENRVGAAGILGAQYVVRAKPDGYTLFVVPGSGLLAAAPSIFKQPGFDPVADFTHIAMLAKIPGVLVVAANSPYKSTADLVADLRSKGDKASYGSLSNSSLARSELFKESFDLKTVEVKFRDFPSALNEMTGGGISFVFVDGTQAIAHIAAGRVRGLAQSGAERASGMPDVPSATEAGIPSLDFSWWSAHLPKGAPSSIIARYEGWFDRITHSEETKAFLANAGASPFPGNSEFLKRSMQAEVESWARAARIAKIEPQ